MMATAKTEDDQKRGENAILGGLGIQILFFCFFIVVTCTFHNRIIHRPTNRSHTVGVPWKMYIFVLYAASLLILVRSVYRVAEYVMGSDGPLMADEAYLLIFDAALMAIVTLLFNALHPSRIVQKRREADIPLTAASIGKGTEDYRSYQSDRHQYGELQDERNYGERNSNQVPYGRRDRTLHVPSY
jgi:hypothetical protein